MVTNTINSKEKHVIEYIKNGDEIVSQGYDALDTHFRKQANGKELINALRKEGVNSSGFSYSYYDATNIIYIWNSFNVPTKNGSHSFVGAQSAIERAINSTHELFGHGIPSARRMSDIENNRNAIHADNLARRLLGEEERGWIGHGDGSDLGNPHLLPIIK